MQTYSKAEKIQQLVGDATRIVIVQADNPDADSVGSALALEHILGDLGKQVYLYCGVDIPSYLRYLDGWDRVNKDLPSQFDLSIIVDASTITLFEKLAQSERQHWLAARPCIILDHHATTDNSIPFATISLIDDKSSSAGELIYHLSKQLVWPLSLDAQSSIMTAILGDTQGLTNQLASAETYQVMTDMVRAGVSRPALEELRREATKMAPTIYKYKAALIDRTEFEADGRLAVVVIPQSELIEYSPLYNPGPLIQPDMLSTAGVKVSIVLKKYDDGKITGAIRCNNTYGIAAELAEHFGGGGHAYASGFKITDGRPFNEVKSECIEFATDLLNNLEQGKTDETLQHSF
jgi:phosphoesterase RecJ-like protein